MFQLPSDPLRQKEKDINSVSLKWINFNIFELFGTFGITISVNLYSQTFGPCIELAPQHVIQPPSDHLVGKRKLYQFQSGLNIMIITSRVFVRSGRDGKLGLLKI